VLPTMRPTLYTVDHPGPGRLSTMAKPRGDDRLADEMAALKDAGVDILVCALSIPELDELGLAAEGQAATGAGLQFVHLPIPDLGVPDVAAITPTLQRLAARLREGRSIVTHCRCGIGRSSLLATALLVINGVEVDDAWSRLTHARQHDVPDTPEQRQWPVQLTGRAWKSDSTE
jgi:protein-tyrosine phosphatase